MDALEMLAHYVREAAGGEHFRQMAKRLGVSTNFVFRAARTSNRPYPAVMRPDLVKLLSGLGLTIAPESQAAPTVADVMALIRRMEIEPQAKEILQAAVHAAGLVGGRE